MHSARKERLSQFWAHLPPTLDMVLEQPRGTFVRRDAQGKRMYVSPLPLPFHYGACPSQLAEDGSGLDVILLGGGNYAVGDRIGVTPVGVADFQDGPDWDPKVIARAGALGAGLDDASRALVWMTLKFLSVIKSSRVFAGRTSRPTQLWGIYPPRQPRTR